MKQRERGEERVAAQELGEVVQPGIAAEVPRDGSVGQEREDRENCTILFPIRIDDAVVQSTAPWAADLRRQRHIGDFSRWKDHAAYQKAFARLLRDLRQRAPSSDTSRSSQGVI